MEHTCNTETVVLNDTIKNCDEYIGNYKTNVLPTIRSITFFDKNQDLKWKAAFDCYFAFHFLLFGVLITKATGGRRLIPQMEIYWKLLVAKCDSTVGN